ncbi:MAG: hypothetical protein KGL43_04835, partial [Burkholderiales bacterium]|nr:hypothetical protein [Burkholderiales bacterium]
MRTLGFGARRRAGFGANRGIGSDLRALAALGAGFARFTAITVAAAATAATAFAFTVFACGLGSGLLVVGGRLCALRRLGGGVGRVGLRRAFSAIARLVASTATAPTAATGIAFAI